MTFPQCSLCEKDADPRLGLLTVDDDYYPLCDGCAPHPADNAETIRCIADLCRMRYATPCQPLGPFGFNETA